MTALGTGVLAWLPPGAVIHARVFPEIKPVHNSFVWTKKGEGPAILLYLERQSRDKFETLSHTNAITSDSKVSTDRRKLFRPGCLQM